MEQNYYCPHCGTPTFYGANFCMGCGIHFKWITSAEAAMNQEVAYTPTQSQLKGKTVLSPVKRNKITEQSTNQRSTAVAEKKELLTEDMTVQFRADVFRLLDSFLKNHANRHRA